MTFDAKTEALLKKVERSLAESERRVEQCRVLMEQSWAMAARCRRESEEGAAWNAHLHHQQGTELPAPEESSAVKPE